MPSADEKAVIIAKDDSYERHMKGLVDEWSEPQLNHSSQGMLKVVCLLSRIMPSENKMPFNYRRFCKGELQFKCEQH